MYACLILSAVLSVLPLPDKAAISAAVQLARDTYKDSLYSEERLRTVLAAADTMADDPAGQAAVCMLVAKEAADNGWLRLAFDAVGSLSRRFEFDGLKAKASLLAKAAKQAKKPDARMSVANRSLELIDQAVAARRFDVADDAAKLAGKLVPSLRNADMRKELAAKRKELDRLKHEHADAERTLVDAEKKLEEDSANGHANSVVGCERAARGEWSKALRHFSLADDQRLREAARADAAAVRDGGRQLAAGDAWWSVADGISSHRKVFRSRAVYWYSLAIPQIAGLAKARVEKRIEEAGSVDLAGQSSGDGGKVTILLAPGVPLVLVKIPASKDGTVGEFWLGQTEVTEAQWAAVMKLPPSKSLLPKTSVSIADAARFCSNLSKEGRFDFTIPSAVQFDHAFLAGRSYQFFADNANRFGWIESGGNLHDAGRLNPNDYGLCDMLGNVWEWCSDGTIRGGCTGESREELSHGQLVRERKNGEGGSSIGFRVSASLK